MARRWTAPILLLTLVPVLGSFALGGRPAGPGHGPVAKQRATRAAPGGGTRPQTTRAVAARRSIAVGRRVARPPDADPQVLLGRYLILSHACGGCHGGHDDPGAPGWLAGEPSPDAQFFIGACTVLKPEAQPCFHTHARNLTPDVETGLGRFTARQIFNALRFGLRPEDTPDVTITSTTPGMGNFPLHPHYLAPPMPWPHWRHMHDQDLWAIAAYLKRGLKPVHHKVPESEGPPDFWAAGYAGAIPELKLGPYLPPPVPTANERSGQQAMSGH